MNRIFKVIWSKSKNCFVVTSELAKNHTGKTKRVTSRKLVEKTMAVTMAVMGLTQMTLPMVSAEYNLNDSGLQIKGVQNGVSNVTTLTDTSLHMTGSGYSTDNVTGAPLAPGYTNDANYTSAGMETTETTVDGRQNTFQASPGGINIYDSRHSGDVNHPDNSTQITATGLKIANSTGAKNEISNTGINVTSADGNTVTKMADTGLTATNSTTGDKTEINQTGITITPKGSTKPTVSLTQGGLDLGGNKGTNFAPGEISPTSTDAVNGSQLYDVAQGVQNNAQAIQQVDKKTNRVGAMGAAMASLKSYYGGPGVDKGQAMIGVGAYHGERALAIGYAYAPNKNLMLNASMSTNLGTQDQLYGIGATWRIGVSGDQSIIQNAEAHKQDAQKIQDMQQRIDTLEKEVQALLAAQQKK